MCFNIHPRYDLSLPHSFTYHTGLFAFAFEPLTSKYDLWQITINSKEDHAVDVFILKNDSAHDTQQWKLVAKIYAVL